MTRAGVRLATYNVLSGRAPGTDPADGHDPAALTRAVGALDADVVAIQEVDRGQPRSGGRDQVDDLVRALRRTPRGGETSGRFLATLSGTPGLTRSWTAAGSGDEAGEAAAYGIGLLTRLPVLAWHELRMTASWGRLPMLVPTPRGRVLPLLVPDEPRAALAVVVQTGSGPLTVIGTHLSFVPPRAIRQLWTLTRWAQGLPGPRVLLGDLNLPGSVPARLTGWTRLADQATFPASSPRVQLDHVLGHQLGPLSAGHAKAVQGEVSDHCALIVDLG